MLGLGLPALAVWQALKGWSPTTLFSVGEQGAWYDPSDLTTMFQDRAGSIPVTADGQTVGLILDKSKGLVLGSELVTNGGPGFSATTGWADQSGNAPLSIVDGKLVATPTSTAKSRTDVQIPVVAGRWYSLTVNMGRYSGPGPTLAVLQARNGAVVPGTTVYSGVGVTTFKFVGIGTSVYLTFGANISVIGVPNILVSASIKELPGNHAVAPTDAARPLYKTDGTYHWLQFDGVDDSLGTASIDFSGTNKMSLFAGVQKTSGTGFQTVVELGTGGLENGFALMAPSSLNNDYDFRLLTSQGTTAGVYVPPIKNVVECQYDCSTSVTANRQKARINGQEVVTANSGSVIVNFMNGSLFVGGRNNSSLYFNGNIYSLIVRGALSTTDEITATETWVASKTGVTL